MTPQNLAEIQGIEMNDSEIAEFLRDQRVGVLSLADESEAYGVPVSFGYDDGGYLAFIFLRAAEESKKHRLAKRTTTASFTTYEIRSKHEWRSVIATGPLRQVDDDSWDDIVETIEDNAWYPSLFSEAEPLYDFRAWKLRLDEVTGQKSDG